VLAPALAPSGHAVERCPSRVIDLRHDRGQIDERATVRHAIHHAVDRDGSDRHRSIWLPWPCCGDGQQNGNGLAIGNACRGEVPTSIVPSPRTLLGLDVWNRSTNDD
jgi:hypothetical protein